MIGSRSRIAATCRGLSRFEEAVALLPAANVAQTEGDDGQPVFVP